MKLMIGRASYKKDYNGHVKIHVIVPFDLEFSETQTYNSIPYPHGTDRATFIDK